MKSGLMDWKEKLDNVNWNERMWERVVQTPLEMMYAINTNSTRSLTIVRPSANDWIGRIYIINSSTFMHHFSL